ncbi:MAG: hypothetical protein IT434_06425 [Phycisphaerales bacterium]|jgi:hypothetical protein|nr:hypothetical protein [Phycisphaerales bacterium]
MNAATPPDDSSAQSHAEGAPRAGEHRVAAPIWESRSFSPVCLSCGFPRKGLVDAIVNCPECGTAWARVADHGWLRDARWGLTLVAWGVGAWFTLGAISALVAMMGDFTQRESLFDMLRCAKAAALLAVWIGARRVVPNDRRPAPVRAAMHSLAWFAVLYVLRWLGLFGFVGSMVWGLTTSRVDLQLDSASSWVLMALEFVAGAGLVLILTSLAERLGVRVRPGIRAWAVLAMGVLAGVGRVASLKFTDLVGALFDPAITESSQVLRGLIDRSLDIFVSASAYATVLAIVALWLVCHRAASRATKDGE